MVPAARAVSQMRKLCFGRRIRHGDVHAARHLSAPFRYRFPAVAQEGPTFDTELPSVRFERGDEIDTGALTRTASGARYIGSFGREIWIKGEEATYRDPDPDGVSYRCVLSTPG